MRHIIWANNEVERKALAIDLKVSWTSDIKEALAGNISVSDIEFAKARSILTEIFKDTYSDVLSKDFCAKPYPSDKRMDFILDWARAHSSEDDTHYFEVNSSFIEVYGSLVKETTVDRAISSIDFELIALDMLEDYCWDESENLSDIKFEPSMMMVCDPSTSEDWHLIDDNSRHNSTKWGWGRYTDLGEAFRRLANYGVQAIDPEKSFYIEDDPNGITSGNLIYESNYSNFQVVFVPQEIYDEACNCSYDEKYVDFQSADALAVHIAGGRGELVDVCSQVRELYGWTNSELTDLDTQLGELDSHAVELHNGIYTRDEL